MHSGLGIPIGMGCPIRTSTDRCLVTDSLWLFAGSHVLHRLSTPRHPPCALRGLIAPTGRRGHNSLRELRHGAQPGTREATRASIIYRSIAFGDAFPRGTPAQDKPGPTPRWCRRLRSYPVVKDARRARELPFSGASDSSTERGASGDFPKREETLDFAPEESSFATSSGALFLAQPPPVLPPPPLLGGGSGSRRSRCRGWGRSVCSGAAGWPWLSPARADATSCW